MLVALGIGALGAVALYAAASKPKAATTAPVPKETPPPENPAKPEPKPEPQKDPISQAVETVENLPDEVKGGIGAGAAGLGGLSATSTVLVGSAVVISAAAITSAVVGIVQAVFAGMAQAELARRRAEATDKLAFDWSMVRDWIEHMKSPWGLTVFTWREHSMYGVTHGKYFHIWPQMPDGKQAWFIFADGYVRKFHFQNGPTPTEELPLVREVVERFGIAHLVSAEQLAAGAAVAKATRTVSTPPLPPTGTIPPTTLSEAPPTAPAAATSLEAVPKTTTNLSVSTNTATLTTTRRINQL